MSQLLKQCCGSVPSLLCDVFAPFTWSFLHARVHRFTSLLFFLSFLPIKRAAGLTPPSTQAWEYSTWWRFQRLFFFVFVFLFPLSREKNKRDWFRTLFSCHLKLFLGVEVTGEKQCAQGLKEMAWLPSVPSHPGRNFSFHCYTGCYSLKMLLFSSEIMWARQGDVRDSHSAEPKRRR